MFAGNGERWKKALALVLILTLCLSMSACRVSPKMAAYETPGIPGTEAGNGGEPQGSEGTGTEDAEEFQAPDAQDAGNVSKDKGQKPGVPENFMNRDSRRQHESADKPERNRDREHSNDQDRSLSSSAGATSGSGRGAAGTTYAGAGDGAAGDSAAENISRYKTVIDATGAAVELPMNVESLTATGTAAQMAEMLGGPGKLVAADSALLKSTLAKTVFSDAGSVESWWNGNGTISEENFEKLLAEKPDVCVQTSGQATFTADQVVRLDAAGIPLVILPALDSVDDLKNGVILMGQMMDDTGSGTGALAVAKEYCSWVDSVVSEVNEKTGGIEMSAIYIAGWDDSATYTLANTKGVIPASGAGLAYAYSPKKSELITSFMKAANVINESTRYTDHFNDSEYAYVTPMFHQLGAAVNGSRATYYSGAGYYDEAFDPFLTAETTGYEGFTYQLGSAFYPSVIVNDTTTLAKIQSSLFWQYRETDETGLADINGQSFQNSIAGLYNMAVNPRGLGNWAEGSLDSPLEAYWAAYVISMSYTLSDVKAETSRFYEKFFGVKLSPAALTNIFGE